MMELIEIYWLAIVTCVLFTVIVSYMGVHLVNRKQAINTIAQSQVTVLSILLGILFFHDEENSLVLIFSFLMTFISGFLFQKVFKSHREYKSQWMIGLYFAFLALGHTLTRVFPQLESHYHQSFQGDIITASNNSLYISLSIFIFVGVFFITKRRDHLQYSFDHSLGYRHKRDDLAFQVISSLVLSVGIFLTGAAYVIAFLILPSLLISIYARSYKEHRLLVIALAFFASLFGFLLSLKLSNLSTTPTMVLSIFGCYIIIVLIMKSLRLR